MLILIDSLKFSKGSESSAKTSRMPFVDTKGVVYSPVTLPHTEFAGAALRRLPGVAWWIRCCEDLDHHEDKRNCFCL